MSELIVVGVDGSAEAATALVFAATEAARRGARVRVVTVNQMSQYWTKWTAGWFPPPPDFVSMAHHRHLGSRGALAGVTLALRRSTHDRVVTCAASAASRIRHGQWAPGVPVPGVVHARQR